MWFQGLVSMVLLAVKCDCSTGVWFSVDEYTDYVNDATQLNCTVAGLLSDDIVIFSRKKTATDKEHILSSSELGKQPKLNLSGIHVSTAELSSNEYLFILTLDSLSCGDRGTYFCKVGERQASAKLIIWQRPGIPIFTMSKIIVENRFMLAEYPLICEGEVGEPSGNIFVEMYTYDSYNKYEYYNVSKDTTLSEDTCSMHLTLKFAVPGTMSLSLNNTAMRCVATNNFILSHNLVPPASQPKRLYVVPENYCHGLSNGNYKHPYECTMFIECKDKWVIPDTCRSLCTHVDDIGIISCRNCSSVDCTDQATIKETTTAILATGTTETICSVDRETPTLTLPRDIYENQRTTVFCTAQLGDPSGSLRIEINSPLGPALRFESPVIISNGNCSNNGRIDLELYFNSSFNGSKIICTVKGPNNDRPSLFQEKIILIKSPTTTPTTIRSMEYHSTSPPYTSEVSEIAPISSTPHDVQSQSQDMARVIIGSLAGIVGVLLVVLVIFCFICFRRKPLKGTTLGNLPSPQTAGQAEEEEEKQDVYHYIDDRKLSTDDVSGQSSTYLKLPELCDTKAHNTEPNNSQGKIMHTDHMEFSFTESVISAFDGSKAPIRKCHSRPIELLPMVTEEITQIERKGGNNSDNYKLSKYDSPAQPPVYSKRAESETTNCYEKLSSLQNYNMHGKDYATYFQSIRDNTAKNEYDHHSGSQRDQISMKDNETLHENNSLETEILPDDYLTPSIYGPFHDEFSRNKHFIPIEDSNDNLKSSTTI